MMIFVALFTRTSLHLAHNRCSTNTCWLTDSSTRPLPGQVRAAPFILHSWAGLTQRRGAVFGHQASPPAESSREANKVHKEPCVDLQCLLPAQACSQLGCTDSCICQGWELWGCESGPPQNWGTTQDLSWALLEQAYWLLPPLLLCLQSSGSPRSYPFKYPAKAWIGN